MDSLKRVPLRIDGKRTQREVVLAKPGNIANSYVVQSIPAFIYGLAYGDLIQVSDDASGDFQVVRNSGQVTVRVFIKGALERLEIRSLIDSVCAHGGLYEIGKATEDPNKTSLLLISLNISIGLSEIKKMLAAIKTAGGQWEYGNIYDENGCEICWWDKS